MQSLLSSLTPSSSGARVARPTWGKALTCAARTSQLGFVPCTAILGAAAIDHLLADWLRIPKTGTWYRRTGPQTGPQVFLAGSSLLQSGISWPEVSETLGQGVEVWTVAGSSPVEWEQSQRIETNSNLTIVGASVYDLNESHLCESSADLVPLAQTVKDLWESRSDWRFAKRVLSQYPLALTRKLFPTAGRSDAVFVGVRRKLRELLQLSSAADDRAIVAITPNQPVLAFGEDNQKVSDWPASKTLRRVALMRNHFQGVHNFEGPKKQALLRILRRAEGCGRVVVVVQPVTPVYAREFLTPAVRQSFEQLLTDAQRACPRAQFVRLDKLPALESDELFSDLVHRNSTGRRISTAAFLKALQAYHPGK
jgi:hypothetical protein